MDAFTDDSGAAIQPPEELEDQEPPGGAEAPAPEPKTVAEKVEAKNRPATPRRPGDNRKDRREAFSNATEKLKADLDSSFKAQLKQMQDNFTAQLAEARRAAAPQQQQAPQQGGGEDQFTAELKEIGTSMQREMALYQKSLNAKEPYDLTRYHELRHREIQIHARRMTFETMRSMGLTPDLLKQLQQGGARPEAYGREAQNMFRFNQLQSEFPQIKGDLWGAVGQYRRYLLSVGREDNLDTDREAAAHVAAERGLHAPQRPRANEARYAGIRSDNRGAPAPREMRLPSAAVRGLSEHERKLAAQAIFSADE